MPIGGQSNAVAALPPAEITLHFFLDPDPHLCRDLQQDEGRIEADSVDFFAQQHDAVMQRREGLQAGTLSTSGSRAGACGFSIVSRHANHRFLKNRFSI